MIFWKKNLRSLPNLPDDTFYAVDAVGLYPNIPQDEDLSALRKQEKDFITSTLVELAEVFLENNIFPFKEKPLKQKRGTAIGTRFPSPYSILLMAELEEETLSKIEVKSYLLWRYIDDIFVFGNIEERNTEEFIKI